MRSRSYSAGLSRRSDVCKLIGTADGITTYEVKREPTCRWMLERAGLKRVRSLPDSSGDIWSEADPRIGFRIVGRDHEGLSIYRVCLPAQTPAP